MKYITLLATTGAAALMGSAALAAPQALTPGQLEGITAGTAAESKASGGAIIAGGSSGTVSSSGSVTVGDGVQAEARALNVVNSSESTVANGVNVFDGRADAEANIAAGTNFNVDQLNEIVQDQQRAASLSAYERTAANRTVEKTNSGSSVGSSSFSMTDSVTDMESVESTISNTTSGSVDALSTLLGQNVQAGRGLAASGSLDVDFDGGDIAFTAEADGSLGQGVVTGEGKITLNIGLPEFSVAIDGSGCAVQNGSCTAEGTNEETLAEMRDNSTLFQVDKSRDYDKTWDKTMSADIRGPMSIHDARAEYVVVDESEINVETDYVVALSGGAQANMRAMNVVNASGSAVANGVNVAQQRSGNLQVGGGPLLNLTQANHIVHSR